jgi:hypothetical protein
LARSDRKRSLNDGQNPNVRVVRVHASKCYHRVEGNRWASRNGRVSDLPETPHVAYLPPAAPGPPSPETPRNPTRGVPTSCCSWASQREPPPPASAFSASQSSSSASALSAAWYARAVAASSCPLGSCDGVRARAACMASLAASTGRLGCVVGDSQRSRRRGVRCSTPVRQALPNFRGSFFDDFPDVDGWGFGFGT